MRLMKDQSFRCFFLVVLSHSSLLRVVSLLGPTNTRTSRQMTPRTTNDDSSSIHNDNVQPPWRRIVYITLEYCQEDLFSGNGVCARSQVRSLSTLYSPSLIQEVIVARPRGAVSSSSSSSSSLHPSDTPPGVRLHVIPVSTWKTTDRSFDYSTFALGVEQTLETLLSPNPTEPPIDAIVVVDWTGMSGVSLLAAKKKGQLLLSHIPIFFLNFRVYARMTDISDEDRAFYYQAESQAVKLALESGGAVVGICDSDTQFLQTMIRGPNDESHDLLLLQDRICTIHPMLRQEFAEIAQRDQDYCLDTRRHRPYLSCIVRLSKDKGPQRFVDLCQQITVRDATFWHRTQTIPFLAGAASQPEFAKELITQLQTHVPQALIMEQFLDPETLSTYLQQTRLNIHPAIYEAFGMTIVEAAACGAPTLLHNTNGAIGAEQLLPIAKGCSLGIDMEQDIETLTTHVMELLENHSSSDLSRVGCQAYHAAVSWTELAYVRVLWELVENRLASHSRHSVQ